MSRWSASESFQRLITDEVRSNSLHRRCFLKLRDSGRSIAAWWRETTDTVVLNSGWLHRETGHAFRCFLLCSLTVIWFQGFLNKPQSEIQMERVAGWILLVLCSISSATHAVLRRRERVRTGLLYSFVIAGSEFYLLGGESGWWEGNLAMYPETRLLYVTVALCHSNVHPIPLLVVILSVQTYWNWATFDKADYFMPFFQIYNVSSTIFQFLLFAAFTHDFTKRVKVVSSGMIFCENPLDSPLMGRSAGHMCWLMGINGWVAWSCHLIGRATYNPGAYYVSLYRNRLPISTCLAFAGLLLLLSTVSSIQLRAWQWDLALLLCCCTPPIMMVVDLMLIGDVCHQPSLVCIEFVRHFSVYGMTLCFMAVQALVQAGCKPLICTGPCMLLTLFLIFSLLHSDAYLWSSSSNELYIAVSLSWVIWVSHCIDYFKRLAAIHAAMERLRENAQSSQSVLTLTSSCLFPHPRAVELQYLSAPEQAAPVGAEGPGLPGAGSGPGPFVAVAVVRHAERADGYQTFNEWGCSEDAEKFPYDPPITSTGVEQVREVAEDLKRQVKSFDLVISSPYLRCLQTAELLAEEFNAVVLLDHELGEVLGPEVFDTQPPMPLRSWQSVKKHCQSGRLKAGRAMGKQPKWPESLKAARLRYAKRFLNYLRRARHVQKSCILVSHGHMLQVAASILPATHHLVVNSVDYCAAVLAMCHKLDDPETCHSETVNSLGRIHRPTMALALRRAASFDSADAVLRKNDPENMLKQNQVILDVNMKYWSVQLKGLRTNSVPASVPPILRQLQKQKDQLGMSWQDLVRLLGVLPAQCDFFPELGSSPCPEDETGGSFQTDAHTKSSMNHFRDPRGMKSSPPSEASGGARSEAPDAQFGQLVLAPAPALPLQLGKSRLARRRTGTGSFETLSTDAPRKTLSLSSLAPCSASTGVSEGADSE